MMTVIIIMFLVSVDAPEGDAGPLPLLRAAAKFTFGISNSAVSTVFRQPLTVRARCGYDYILITMIITIIITVIITT